MLDCLRPVRVFQTSLHGSTEQQRTQVCVSDLVVRIELDGSTKTYDRAVLVRSFQHPAEVVVRLFVIRIDDKLLQQPM